MSTHNRKTGASRNFGYAFKVFYAVRLALLDAKMGHCTKTRESYYAKFKHSYYPFLKEHRNITDMADVDINDHQAYALYLKDQVLDDVLTVGTAQNYISAANCILSALRGDKCIWVSPSLYVGKRSLVRTEPPYGAEWNKVDQLFEYLTDINEYRLAVMIVLARLCGLRAMESSLLDIRTALKDIYRTGSISIVRGTKGGRARSFVVPDSTVVWLERLVDMVPGSRVIPDELSFKQWYKKAHALLSAIADNFDISTKFHTYRAAYGCDRYQEETGGILAPVYTGGRTATREIDTAARTIVSRELGHNRINAAGPYVGTSKKVKEIIV